MSRRKDLQALKASGRFPEEWFAGYTKMGEDEQAALIAKCVAHDGDGDGKSDFSEWGDALTPSRSVPEGIPTTSDGYPVRVQVIDTRTVRFGRSDRTFRRANIFRGEIAWQLWDDHRDLVRAIE